MMKVFVLGQIKSIKRDAEHTNIQMCFYSLARILHQLHT